MPAPMSAGIMSAGIPAGISLRGLLARAVGWKPSHLNAGETPGILPAPQAFGLHSQQKAIRADPTHEEQIRL